LKTFAVDPFSTTYKRATEAFEAIILDAGKCDHTDTLISSRPETGIRARR